jgi:hypothetical protein
MNYGKIAHMRLKAVITLLVAAGLISYLSAPTSAGEVKAVAKKTAKPIPSPAQKWPPLGFKGKDGVYAKVPTSKELIGLLSAKRSLQATVKICEEFACGAVIAAAETGCDWWEVNSNLFRVNPDLLIREKIGLLTTYAKASDKRVQATIFLISSEPVTPGVSISGIKVTCHRNEANKPKPGNIYKSLLPPTPTPTPEN